MNKAAHKETKVMRGFPTPEQMSQEPQQYETQSETAHEQEPVQIQPDEKFLDENISALKKALGKKPKNVPQMPQVRDEMTIRVEHIMEHGLADAFKSMTPIQKQQFKMKGEETALKLRAALKKTSVKIKDIFKLVFEWLRFLPGVNKFYIEQEAKIKADKILALRHFDDHNTL